MTQELKSERVTIMMSPSEVRALDDFRFANRIGSRGEVVRLFVSEGLAKRRVQASGPQSNDQDNASIPEGEH